MSRSRLILPPLVALALAGCGGDDGSTTDSTGASAEPVVSNDVDVSLTEYAAVPSNALPLDLTDGGPPTSQAKAGEVTFTVTNDGEETHSFVFNNAGKEIPIDGDLAPGDSAELTVDVTGGFYEYYCPIGDHQEQGMQGQLEVD